MTLIKAVPDVTRYVPDFAAYLALEPAWGIFHVALEDGNYDFGATDAEDYSELEDHLAHIFSLLSPTQRSKLGRLARKYVAPEGESK